MRTLPLLLASVIVALATMPASALQAAAPAATAALPSPAEVADAEAGARSHPDDPDRITRLAIVRLRQGDTAAGNELLTQALRISPNQPAANLALGELLLRQNRLPEAMDRFETVLRISRDPAAQGGELVASTRLALQAKRAGDGAAAYRCLEHASQFLPGSAELLTDLGVVAEQLGRYDSAREALRRALVVEPHRPAALYAMARVELAADHLADAETYFRAYLAVKPDDATAFYGLGRTLHRQQRDADAEAALRQSVALQPVQTESYYELGAIALDAHRDADAKALFAKTLSRDPHHGGALTGMGEISYRARDFAAAKQSLAAAVASSPDYQPAHYYLGLTLGRLGEKEASTAELARATELIEQQQGKSRPVAGERRTPPP